MYTLLYPCIPMYTLIYPYVSMYNLIYPNKPICTPLYTTLLKTGLLDNAIREFWLAIGLFSK